MKLIRVSFIAIAFVYLTGCATIIKGSSQRVTIFSQEKGTELFVNEVKVGDNTAEYTFKKKNEYFISARKEGCRDAFVEASKSFDPVSLLGFLIDYGLISILLVDNISTGAMYEFDKETYIVTPDCD